jgi:hypothetical protein
MPNFLCLDPNDLKGGDDPVVLPPCDADHRTMADAVRNLVASENRPG